MCPQDGVEDDTDNKGTRKKQIRRTAVCPGLRSQKVCVLLCVWEWKWVWWHHVVYPRWEAVIAQDHFLFPISRPFAWVQPRIKNPPDTLITTKITTPEKRNRAHKRMRQSGQKKESFISRPVKMREAKQKKSLPSEREAHKHTHNGLSLPLLTRWLWAPEECSGRAPTHHFLRLSSTVDRVLSPEMSRAGKQNMLQFML